MTACARVRAVRGRHLLVLVLVSLVAAIAGAEGGRRGPSAPVVDLDQLQGGAKLHALVQEVEAHQRALRSLRAHFRQVKESSLLLAPAESSGTFRYLAPDQVRWDYRLPDPMVVVFDSGTVTTFFPAQKRADRVELHGRQRRFLQVLAGTQPLDELQSQFRMTLADPGGDAPYRLTLEPVSSLVRRKLSAVELHVDRHLLLPVSIEVREADGDLTRYEFSDIRVDPPLEPDVFKLELGPDVRVSTVRAPAAGND